MTEKLANLLASYSDDLDVRDDYSGRGMFGENTYALVGAKRDFFGAIGQAFESLIDEALLMDNDDESQSGEEDYNNLLDLRDELVGYLPKIQMDSMGLDNVFY